MKEDDKFRVYIISADYLGDCFNDYGIDAFTEAVNDDAFISYDCEKFETKKDALKFLEGVFYGCDERSPCGKIALCSWNEYDEPFINALLNV